MSLSHAREESVLQIYILIIACIVEFTHSFMSPDSKEPEKDEIFIPNRAGRRQFFAMMRKVRRGPNRTPKKKKRK